jgi:hypothetical protein
MFCLAWMVLQSGGPYHGLLNLLQIIKLIFDTSIDISESELCMADAAVLVCG